MASSRAERYAARVLRLLSRAFLALLGLVSRASSLAAPSPSLATASPPAAAAAASPLSCRAAFLQSRKVRCVPPPSDELLLVPGVELARRIRRKEGKL
ncbi:UNVERIFIED_CONTAM: hypothetical protein K2H54_043437 [Gekko kuhli]